MMTNAVPNSDYGDHEFLLPPGSKDSVNALTHSEASVSPATEPPITRHVTLPEKVSVKFLTELSGRPRYAITALMTQLGVSLDRSICFEDAEEILRRYGIAAERVI